MHFHPLCDRLALKVAPDHEPLAWLRAALDVELEAQRLLQAWAAQSHLHAEPLPRIERSTGLWRLLVPRGQGDVPLLTVRAPTRPMALLRGIQAHQLKPNAHAMMLRLLAAVVTRAAAYLPAAVDLAQGERTGVPAATRVRIGRREEHLRWANGMWLLERTLARTGFQIATARPAFLTSVDGLQSLAVRAVPVPAFLYDHRDGYHWVVPATRPGDPPRAVSGLRVHHSARHHDRVRYELLTRELVQLRARRLEHTAHALAVTTVQQAMRARVHLPEAAHVVR